MNTKHVVIDSLSEFGMAVIAQRHIEIEGEFKRAFPVVNVRCSQHSKDICLFDVTDDRIVNDEPLSGRPSVRPSPVSQ